MTSGAKARQSGPVAKRKSTDLVPAERIASRIFLVRGETVMLDADLADLYGVTTAALNQQVKRNQERFPKDFAFQLSGNEFDYLISQIVISNVRLSGMACHAKNATW